jgi:hypothetical protein
MRFDEEIHFETEQAAIRVADIRFREPEFATIIRADDAKADALLELGDLTLHDTLHFAGSRPLVRRLAEP